MIREQPGALNTSSMLRGLVDETNVMFHIGDISYARGYANVVSDARAYMHTHHLYAHAHTHSCMHTHLHCNTGVHLLTCICKHACTHNYITNVYTHTYMYMYCMYSLQWDEFFDEIQPVSANVPYMVCIGNHERNWPEPRLVMEVHVHVHACIYMYMYTCIYACVYII